MPSKKPKTKRKRRICVWPKCRKTATTWASAYLSDHAEMYCAEHADKISSGGEYTVDCPNCRCRFGV